MSLGKFHHEIQYVGKNIKSTKMMFLWTFELNSNLHKVEVFHSRLTGRRKVCLDSKKLIEERDFRNNFTYSFKINLNYFNIVQLGDDQYDLRIDNRSIINLIEDEKNGNLNFGGLHRTKSTQNVVVSKKEEPKKNQKKLAFLSGQNLIRDNDEFFSKEIPDFDFSPKKIKQSKTTKANNSVLIDYENKSGSYMNDNKNINLVQTYGQNKSVLNNFNMFFKDMPNNHESQTNNNNNNVLGTTKNMFRCPSNKHSNSNNFGTNTNNMNLIYSPNANMRNTMNINPSSNDYYPHVFSPLHQQPQQQFEHQIQQVQQPQYQIQSPILQAQQHQYQFNSPQSQNYQNNIMEPNISKSATQNFPQYTRSNSNNYFNNNVQF